MTTNHQRRCHMKLATALTILIMLPVIIADELLARERARTRNY